MQGSKYLCVKCNIELVKSVISLDFYLSKICGVFTFVSESAMLMIVFVPAPLNVEFYLFY